MRMSYALTLAGIAAVNLLGSMSPGPAFVMVTRISVAESRAAAIAAGLGVATGAFAWATAASLGVGALLASAAVLFTLLKLAGGAYLLWLGVQAWRHAGAPPAAAAMPDTRMTPLRAYRVGLTTNLSNPKVIVFFGSIFVALFAPGTPLWVRLAALGLVACDEALWYTLVALAFSAGPVQRGYRRARRWIDRVTGSVMVVFGVRLLAAARG
jgi:threonine efflux protein